MNAKEIATQILHDPKIVDALDLHPMAGNFLACIVTAFVASLPKLITDVMSCMAGGISDPPTTGGYNPGDRNRC